MFNQILKKTRPYIRLSATILLAVGLWVGLFNDVYALSCIAHSQKAGTASDPGTLYISSNCHDWTDKSTIGASRYWNVSTASKNGQYMIAGLDNSRLYLSTDYGANWSEIQPAGNNNRVWKVATISNDGHYMIVGVYSGTNGRLYRSTDYGANWSEIRPDGDVNKSWISCEMSMSGTYVLCAHYNTNKGVFLSTDYGANWSELTINANNPNWSSVTMNDSGQYMLAVGTGTGDYADVYLSTNYGVNWSEVLSTYSPQAWTESDISATGQYMAVLYDNVYLSTDYGANWSTKQINAESKSIRDVSFDADGSTIMVAVQDTKTPDDGGIYESTDNGNNWTNYKPTGTGAYAFAGITVAEEYSYYTPSEISITYPATSSTSKAEYWTVDADTNDDTTYDEIVAVVRAASTEACAENTACDTAWWDTKTIGECDGVDSTFDNTSNVSRYAQIPDSMDGETVYATPFLIGYTAAECADTHPSEVVLATGDTISFTYSIDYITDLSDADEYWAGTWADRWGAATSTASYQAVAGGFDVVMGPVVNWASGWSHLFNTADATDAGISAGSGIQILMQHTKDFFNVIPGCQLFAIILIAIIIDIAIYIYKNIYRIKKFFTI